MYKDTITLFNRLRGREGDTWYPTILRGVNLNIDKGAIAEKYGSDTQDNAVLNVRFTKTDSGIMIGNKLFLPPMQWQRSNTPGNYITFASGTGFDFFHVGEWEQLTPILDDNYGDLTFYDFMLQNYDFVYAVTSVSYFDVIPHIEVLAR